MSTKKSLDYYRMLREPRVLDLTGLSARRREELERLGKFPKRVRLTDSQHNGAVAWVEGEILEWLQQRIEKSEADRNAKAAKAPKLTLAQRIRKAAPVQKKTGV